MHLLEFSLTKELLAEYLAIARVRIFRRPPDAKWWQGKIGGAAISASITIAAMALAIIILPTTPSKPLYLSVLLAGILTGLFIWQAEAWHTLYVLRDRLYRNGGPHLTLQNVTVDPHQLRFASTYIETILRWPAVIELTEHKHILVLWIEPSHGFVIPRSAFADEAAAMAFIDFAREHITAAKEVPT